MTDWKYPYRPHPKQRVAHAANTDELLFGGAAGPGKTDMLLAAAVTLCLVVPGSKALVLRRTFPQLEQEIIPRLKTRIPAGIAKYNEQKKAWQFRNGSILRLGHLENKDAVANYDGGEYQLICWDELTHFDEYMYTTLMGRVRAAGDVAKRMRAIGMKPRMLGATNPGGRGHHWVKARFVDPAPEGTMFVGEDGMTRMFVSALSFDNPDLDEDYRKKLNALPAERRKALRDGDWNVFEGVRFASFRDAIHVIKPEQLPLSALSGPKVLAVDYGFSAPFAGLWLCKLHDGLVVVYREAYKTELTATQQAQLLRSMEGDMENRAGQYRGLVMDRAMWNRRDATADKPLDPNAPPVGSPAHDYQTVFGQTPTKAMNDRVNGWALVDEKLRVREDGLPRLLIYDTCRELIRTLPSLPRDSKNPEDVDTTSEDHLADALRYGINYLEPKGPSHLPDHAARAPEAQTISGVLAGARF